VNAVQRRVGGGTVELQGMRARWRGGTAVRLQCRRRTGVAEVTRAAQGGGGCGAVAHVRRRRRGGAERVGAEARGQHRGARAGGGRRRCDRARAANCGAGGGATRRRRRMTAQGGGRRRGNRDGRQKVDGRQNERVSGAVAREIYDRWAPQIFLSPVDPTLRF
jgi:hypothetical protein